MTFIFVFIFNCHKYFYRLVAQHLCVPLAQLKKKEDIFVIYRSVDIKWKYF